ncbi:MAG: xylulokinase [Halanaerobiaceae bacterium]
MGKYIIAHDFGTTGNKATLYNEEGQLINSTFSGYPTYYPRVNWAEQDPHDWWEAVCASTKKLVNDSKINKKEIAVISFSAQMMGCLPVDKKGEPLRRSIIWADQRSIEQADYLEKQLGEEKVYNITGHKISPTYSLEKIMWIKDNEPEIYKKTFKFLQAKDFIIYKLTGNYVTDYSDACGMNLFDINKKEWSVDIIQSADVEINKLPKPHSSFDIAGKVSQVVANKVGLNPGTPVVIGAGDGASATVGAGVVEKGHAYNYIGSSSWIALATEKPIIDQERQTFNWIHMDPELYIPCGTMQSAGASYNWLKENICLMEKETAVKMGYSPYEIMNIAVRKSKPTSNNLIFLPYLMGERSPHWNPDARGAFIGLTLKHERKDMIRSVMEGVTYNLKIISDIFEKFIEFNSIRVIGGGAKARVWREIMSDIYNKEILKPDILEEATSLGAAVAGGVGVGIFDSFEIVKKLNPVTEKINPNERNVKKYKKFYPLFKKSYYALKEIYQEMSLLD